MFRYGEYKISFKHVTKDRAAVRQLNKAGKVHTPFAEQTVCVISKASEPEGIPAIGVSMCSLKDQFDRAKGREIAFARAMHQIALDKQERLLWWKAFWLSADGYHTKSSIVAWFNDVLTTQDFNDGEVNT